MLIFKDIKNNKVVKMLKKALYSNPCSVKNRNLLKKYFNTNHMQTKTELEQRIIRITGKIHKEFPELVKYITEIPIHISAEAEGNIKNLEDYYSSLEEIIHKYSKTHKKN
jgi:phage host-nuclease inhibitor protein Gam